MKIQKIIILVLIFLSCKSQSIRANAPINNNSTIINTTNINDIYFQENPWDFLELKLIKEAKTPKEIDISKFKNFLGTFIITSIITMMVSSPIICTILNKEPDRAFRLLIFIGIMGGLISSIIRVNSLKYRSIYDSLEEILKNYNPDLKQIVNNTKKYIPKEIHSTFDSLYENYQTHGKNFLETQANRVIFSIRDKIMAQLKPGKYYQPKVKIYGGGHYFRY